MRLSSNQVAPLVFHSDQVAVGVEPLEAGGRRVRAVLRRRHGGQRGRALLHSVVAAWPHDSQNSSPAEVANKTVEYLTRYANRMAISIPKEESSA